MKNQEYKTILLLSSVLCGLYYFSSNETYLFSAIILMTASFLSSFIAEKIHFTWMKIGHLMGLVIPKVLLTVIFYLFLFPLSILQKIIEKKDPLLLKASDNSTFKAKKKTYNEKSFERMW